MKATAALLGAVLVFGMSACTNRAPAAEAVSQSAVEGTPVPESPRPASPGVTGSVSPFAGGTPVPAALLRSYRGGQSFFARVEQHGGSADVELDSATTGQRLLSILPLRRGRVFVVSIAAMGTAQLLVTYGTGENCSNGTGNCGPLPNVCGGEVDILDLTSGVVRSLWTFPRSVHVDGATPSPDGTDIAARVAPCQGSYFGDYLQVRRLRDGNTWSIGHGLKGCRWLSPASWVGTGHRLVVSYAPPTSAHNCAPSSRWVVVGLNAEASQPGFSGAIGAPTGRCQYASVAARGSLVYAYAQCSKDAQDYLDLEGPIRLVRLDPATLRPLASRQLGSCGNGSALAVTGQGDVLLERYHYCHSSIPNPQSVLQRLRAGTLTTVTTHDRGSLYYDGIAAA